MKKKLTKQLAGKISVLSLVLFLIILNFSCKKDDKELDSISINPKPYNKEQVAAFSKTLRDGTRFLAALREHKSKNAKLLPINEQQYEDSLFANNNEEFRAAYLARKESKPVKNFEAGIEAWTDTDGDVNGIENYEVIDRYFQESGVSNNVRAVMKDLILEYNQVTDEYEKEVDKTGNGDSEEYARRLQDATRKIEDEVINRDDISYSDKESIFTTTTSLIENIPFLVQDTKDSIDYYLGQSNGRRTFFGKLWRAAVNVVVVAVVASAVAVVGGAICGAPCFGSAVAGGVWQMGKMVFGNNYLFGCTKIRRCNSSGTNCYMACEIW